MIKRFLKDTAGLSALEYGILIGLLATALVAGLLLIGPSFSSSVGSVSTAAKDSVAAAAPAPAPAAAAPAPAAAAPRSSWSSSRSRSRRTAPRRFWWRWGRR